VTGEGQGQLPEEGSKRGKGIPDSVLAVQSPEPDDALGELQIVSQFWSMGVCACELVILGT
jgi:hypothetical protein